MSHPVFEVPQITQDYAEVKHILYDSVIETWAQKVLELGSDVGDSTRIFATALRETGGHLWTVDVLPPKWYPEIMEPYKNITIITEDTEKFQTDELFDLLFIDDHNDETKIYSHVLGELLQFGPQIKKGGRILIHDVIHPRFGDGSRKAIGEWCWQNKLSWTIERRTHGLGIIQL